LGIWLLLRNDQFLEKHIGEKTRNVLSVWSGAPCRRQARDLRISIHVIGFYQKGGPIDSNALYGRQPLLRFSRFLWETIGGIIRTVRHLCFNVARQLRYDGNSQPRDIRAALSALQ
jgi:hypothetical protein